MPPSDGSSSISVTVRVRPFTIREAAQLTKCEDGPLFLGDGSLAGVPTPKLTQKGIRPVIKVVDDRALVFDPPEDNPVQRFSRNIVPTGKRVKDQTFVFDRVFDENTTQGDVYEATTRTLLDSVIDGYNATVFAYGATGCGKTHTITGTVQQPGIIFLTMQELFERIQEVQGEKQTELSLSYLEIYNETIRDLLVPGGSKPQGLSLREDANQAVSVSGLSSHHPQNVQEVMDMIVRGNECRTMSPTEANATSSRSHAVLQINVSQKDRNADVNEPHTMATLSIIDLAGSERASATKNRGERLIEGANINKSLLALGSCINALCDPRKRNHVPYRNSKLTRLLKFSLGGNCRTVMIVCVSPSSAHFDETQNTLRYANRAKNIQTKVTRNVYNVNRHVKDFLKKIDEQMALINELKAQQKDSEGNAFAKLRKQSERREAIAREGIARIRNAYDHCTAERSERMANMKRLRQVERRITMISSWIAAFDQVCDTREEEEPPKGLVAMRKMAQGILVELEGSRQHYHQRLAKSNWDRALDTALQTGLRQLKETEGVETEADMVSLMKESELLKANADREAYTAVLEQEKGGDAALVQVLLQAHFDTIAILNQILHMEEEEAVRQAKAVLGKIIAACSDASSQVIKPDGGLPVTEVFPPTKSGTPKRRKGMALMGPSPIKATKLHRPSLAVADNSSLLSSGSAKMSPRRRKVTVGGNTANKRISFTPRKHPKHSPVRLGLKRGVRWRDDTQDGTLAEFEKTPQKQYVGSTPTSSSVEVPLPPQLDSSIINSRQASESSSRNTGSSPLPALPETSFDTSSTSLLDPKPLSSTSGSTSQRPSRFQTGFLSKSSTSGSPSPAPAPSLPRVRSDIDHDSNNSNNNNNNEPSPLREVDQNTRTSFLHSNGANAPPPTQHKRDHQDSNDATLLAENNASNGSDSEGALSSRKGTWKVGAEDAKRISGALKRQSSIGNSSHNNAHHPPRHSNAHNNTHRRRSPTVSSAGSPPPNNSGESQSQMFTASHARRMVKPDRDSTVRGVGNVLSPRITAGDGAVGKGGGIMRSVMRMGEERGTRGAGLAGLDNGAAVVGAFKTPAVPTSSGRGGSGGRTSVAAGAKGFFRV